MKKLLLHSCCGPCSSGVLEDLAKEYDITILFYNPNIYPEEEYLRRLEAQKQVVDILNKEQNLKIKLVEADYDLDTYFTAVNGYEEEKEGGARCEKCFRLRLGYACKYAKENGFDIFTTTLSISPHKDFELLNAIGQELAQTNNMPYLWANFKKNNGFLKSINNSKKFGIYRQNYCGCKFSIWF